MNDTGSDRVDVVVWWNAQDERSQQNHVIEGLRVELDAAREEKSQTETRYTDSLTEIETLKKERDEVKQFCQVNYYSCVINQPIEIVEYIF